MSNSAEKLKRELRRLGPGEHICSIYRNKEEQLAVITAFMNVGLERKEKCIYIVEERSKQEIIRACKKAGIDMEKYLASKHFEFLGKDDAYLKKGYFTPGRMIDMLRQAEKRAIKDGFTGLRVTGEMTRVFSGLPGTEKLLEYESRLNYFVPESRCMAMCQYNEKRFSPEILLEVIRTHPKVIVYCDLCENPCYLPPDMKTKKEAEKKTYQMVRDNLVERKRDKEKSERAEKALKESEQMFETIFESAVDGILLADPEDKTIYLGNKKICQMLGYSLGELKKLKVMDIHPREELSYIMEQFERQVGREITFSRDIPVKRKDGSVFFADINSAPIKVNDKVYLMGIFRDITERRESEEKIQHLNAVLRAIRKVNQLISVEKNRHRLLEGICKNLVETRGYYHVWVVLIDGAGNITESAEAGLGDKFKAFIKQLERGNLPTCFKQAWKKPEAMVIKKPLSTCPDCPLVNKYPGMSAMIMRLENGGKMYGLLAASIPESYIEEEQEISLFEEVAGDIALALHGIEAEEERRRTEEEIKKILGKLQKIIYEITQAISVAIAKRDPYTSDHARRVTQLACAIAKNMGIPGEEIKGLQVAGLLHDIGKIAVPIEILNKPGRLNEIEFDIIKEHPEVGFEILRRIDFPWPVAEIILQHHERMDGSGYPQGLKGDRILLGARILAVADVVEAMSSHRPYRPALGIDKALEEILQNKEKLYDSDVVEACMAVLKKGFKFKEEG